MAFFIIALTAIVATCSAAIVPSDLPHPALSHPGYASPLLDGWGGQVASPLVRHRLPEEYAPAHYNFDYSVNDPITGDSKDQAETRVGDDVQGHYSLIEADGSKRIVEYTAGVQGFNAVVHKEPATGPLVGPAAKIAPSLLVSAVPRTPSWNGLNSWDSYNPYTHNALATPYGLASPYSRHAIADQYSHHALNAPYNQYGYGHPAHRTPLDARSGPWGLY